MKVYHLGNSLTRNIPLERLQMLFESVGGIYDYGIQLGGGHRLEQHLSKRNHNNRPGEGVYNTKEPYGEYDHAFQNFTFDAVVLQPFKCVLNKEHAITDEWPYFSCGDLQAASAFINYARGRTERGAGRWDWDHPNTKNVACETFYIYATWPHAEDIVNQNHTYATHYAHPYKGDVQICADFFTQFVDQLNRQHPDLPVSVRQIPAGEVFSALDKKIRTETLPGIEVFFQRNQPYFVESRRNGTKPSPYDPDAFDPSAGILNIYADGVHLNDQPHNGPYSGTIGSYIAALTVYTTLSAKNPVGLTATPYEQFDQQADAELILALQETVRDIVIQHPLTGIDQL